MNSCWVSYWVHTKITPFCECIKIFELYGKTIGYGICQNIVWIEFFKGRSLVEKILDAKETNRFIGFLVNAKDRAF